MRVELARLDLEALESRYRQRRTHKKSRDGCTSCKQRRIKCDEERPLCGNCKKRSVTCSYPSRDSSRAASNGLVALLPRKSDTHTQHTLNDELCFPIPLLQSPKTLLSLQISELRPPHLRDLNMGDLELMHGALCGGFGLTSDVGVDLRLGVEFPYVQHMIFNLTALRMYDKQPRRKELLDLAHRHQDYALQLARPDVAALSTCNVSAVLRFSFLIAISCLGMPLYQHPDLPLDMSHDPIEILIQSFHMTRGIRFIHERRWKLEDNSIHGGGPELDDEDPFQQGLVLKYPVYPAVRDLIVKHCNPGHETLVCLDALHKVFSLTDLIEGTPDLWHDARLIQLWPIEIDQYFMALLCARREIAMVILGYYSALLKTRSGCLWPFGAWPAVLLNRVEETLGEKWGSWLEWPRERVFFRA